MIGSPIWHPFTQHALTPDMLAIASAEGAYLHGADGRRYLDAISSWWVITHGHCHPRITAAIRAQAEKLDQIIFAGFTHEPAETLARRLVEITPAGLDYVFFSDSGSTSVEVALKMALGFWANRGAPRQRILMLEHAYHGDTIGAMSVGARGVFNQPYEPLLFAVETIPFPAEGREQATLDALDAACRTGGTPPAAFIVEPLVLGAGGMLMYRAETLREMKRICEASDVLFIADEVMTGWGRTGTLFACEQAGIVPDIACYAKGITGGALPLAVTLCAARIFDAHYSEDRRKTFFHSSSYTANPIACAAALENLRIWEDEPVLSRIAAVEAMHRRHLPAMAALDRIEAVRCTGSIAAMDLRTDAPGYLADIGLDMRRFFQGRGLLLRPLGNTVYILPPYCVTKSEIDGVYSAITDYVAEMMRKQ
ncbi:MULTISPECIES: adenosylmethionine--8-amino-7-oxononanoate transaminase [Rhodomicrobium]|uniref:adenosylmethionine--8-amino-7-oxononanoate transaminase n=1 Tax=Rhodomicrobium TaxID=1068 RepID=UPI000B4B5B49|nr:MULTISPECIES: adenosylmethionine--8-amino-7-oxononanoate transaminase [Rhodomicrobium]